METKEYIVILERGIDYNQFWREMETSGKSSSYVPERSVSIVDEREAMDRMCVYTLTDQEAEILKNDPRVKAVDIPLENRNDWVIVPTSTQDANFNKPSTAAGTNKNWGLIRHNYATNVYGSSTSTALDYIYTLDGSNVDVVIMDTGIQANHPEWQDANGVSRLKQINWFTTTGTIGTQPTNFYTDTFGHGTCCAGVAVGKTFGWAKNANIYSITLYNNSNNISWSNAITVLKKFHQQKLVNPATGVKNPTIVNMSFTQYYSGVNTNYTFNGITYRNVSYSGSGPVPGGLSPNFNYGLVFSTSQLPQRTNELDVSVQELLDAGIIVCIAAANDKQKIDQSGGVDYLNSINIVTRPFGSTIPSTYYYMQGSSPYDRDAVIVGAIDSTPANSSTDQKAEFSRAGPGVDIFAAGANVMSSISNTSTLSAPVAPYNNTDPTFKQALIDGTSFATPQIIGMAALYLQANPTATPAQVKSWLLSNSVTSTLYNTGLTNDYSNQRSQWGGNAGVAYQNIQGLTQVKTATNQWRPVKAVSVKNASNQWEPVKNTWTKDASGEWKQTYTAS
jgi:subtilisin family serine protease